ncbi:hypothetical protein SAMN04487779_1002445 [Belnapia rosea]|uniref:Uncharacterized protein n=1 Tax=Belnapia rosea TaxID=938405 RepID=A0A1G6PM98_9PROT|nr:hypothetical protein SAMN04487779_1002445 [Belnapia rosea]
MANVETLRQGPAPAVTAPTDPAAFRSEDRLTGLLAFALAAERQEEASPETVALRQREAEAALCDHALRYLHNNIERLRQEAVAEQLGRLGRPPSFLRLVAANLVALAILVAAGGWLALHPETLAGVTGLLAG